MVVINLKNMSKFNVVLFYIIGIIYVVESNPPKILVEETVEENEAADSLTIIQPEEALPLVLFKLGQNNTLHLPDRLQKVASIDGKIIAGTEFKFKECEQMFFCPEKNTRNKCLVPKTFDVNERLRCDSEVPLVIESGNVKCGPYKQSIIYKAIYQICENNQYKFTTKEIQFYRFCYDEKKEETLFVIYVINSPELLNAKLLLREREVNYRIMEKNQFPIFKNQKSDKRKVEEKSSSQVPTPKPGYAWQKLVPSEDMALALWRKTTSQRVNTALQHEKLINLWDKISKYVRFYAIKKSTDGIRTWVYTGVFDLAPVYKNKDDDQLSNIWIKVVFHTFSPDAFTTEKAYQGIAILMNNFVETGTRRYDSYSKAIKEYCDQDLCNESLSEEFEQIKGQVRCCLVNQKILDLFNETNNGMGELRILNINVTENHETFTRSSEITDAQAAASISEIKSNEVLPLILISDLDNFKLSAPVSLDRIEIKNKIIVSGSDFSRNIRKKQILFCPREDLDQKCFAPQTFGRFKPLQCNKQIVPVIRKLPDSLNECGIDNSGKLYEVVYEICPAQQPYRYRENKFQLYQFCYDSERKIILFTHHKIMAHELLASKLLFRERNMEYQMIPDDTLPLANQKELEEASQKETESPYKLQKLVPSEDMAFALWKKSTYLYINAALQHKTLIPLWNDINRYVKQNAYAKEETGLYYFKYEHSLNSIYAGVLYKKSFGKDLDDKNPEIWFKIIYTEEFTSGYDKGLIILMKNSVISEKTPSGSTNLETEENILGEYCSKSICENEFEKKFQQVGGQVYCCKYDEVIAKKLGIPHKTIPYQGTLRIPTINHM